MKKKWGSTELKLGYHHHEDRFLDRVISIISVVPRESTLTISVSTGQSVSMESEIVRVVSLSTTEISEIRRLKIGYSGSRHLKRYSFRYADP